eukprot:365443-Chlamydomonas_euryale.AAC.14
MERMLKARCCACGQQQQAAACSRDVWEHGCCSHQDEASRQLFRASLVAQSSSRVTVLHVHRVDQGATDSVAKW